MTRVHLTTRMCVVLPLLLLAPGCTKDTDSAVRSSPTFARDVAPIVYSHCVVCHRPGQSAPFSLLSYRDVSKRSRQIAEVVASRFMPPWLPEAGQHAFEHDRRLSDAHVETLVNWHVTGAPEGDPADLPSVPIAPTGWSLGEPDLVLRTDVPYRLAADGADVFRNLVLNVPVGETRYVRAIEFRPGASNVVHHAIIAVDRVGECRRRAALEDGAGFAGMTMGTSEPPDGHFLGWTPGRRPYEVPAAMSWRLYPGDDIVLQLHMTKSGKEELVAPEVGLYFTDTPPTVFPHTVVLYSEEIDIPAGEPAHPVVDSITLPVDVELLGVYPHAHYLGSSVTGAAVLPDGSKLELLRIRAWDFDWQDEYHYREPVFLPAGTQLSMEWIYDNSTDNPRNPNHPPARVGFGESSSDEMGTLSFLVLPRNPLDLALLQEARWRATIAKKPYDWDAYNSLGSLLADSGREQEAASLFRNALALRPEYPDALSNLGLLTLGAGQFEDAAALFQRALAIDPEHDLAGTLLGKALAAMGRTDEAVAHLRTLIARRPRLTDAQLLLADVLALGGRPAEALDAYVSLLRIEPDLPEANNNLANTLFMQGDLDRAIEHYERALRNRPDYFNASLNLGRALVANGQQAAGVAALREAVRLQPGSEVARAELNRALDQQ